MEVATVDSAPNSMCRHERRSLNRHGGIYPGERTRDRRQATRDHREPRTAGDGNISAAYPCGLRAVRDRPAFRGRFGRVLESERGRRDDAGHGLAFLQLIVASEPIAHTSTDREDLNQRGDSTAGLQVVLMPGHGVKPTISSSYLHLVRMGTASSLDIGGYSNSASADGQF